MSTETDTYSSSGDEWEETSKVLSESNLEELNIQKETAKKQNEEIERLKDENKRLTLQNKTVIEENLLLKSAIADSENVFSLEEWMKAEIEDMKLSTDSLSDNMLEVYKVIWKKGMTKMKSTSTPERKKLGEEIQELEDLCAKLSKNSKKSNEESINEIKKQLTKLEEIDVPEEDKKKNIIQMLDGKYNFKEGEKGLPIEISIEKDDTSGFYVERQTYEGSNGEYRWIPDGVVRDGRKATIYGHKIIVSGFIRNWTWCYTLEGNDIIYSETEKDTTYTKMGKYVRL